MRVPIVLVVVLLSLVGGNAQQKKDRTRIGMIHGRVVSQNGDPVKRIWLMAHPLSGGQWPGARSDDRGDYLFSSLPYGKYTIQVEDNEAGYSTDLAEESSEPAEVEISPERPDAAFQVVLPPKAGQLQIHLTNRRTGERIKKWMSVTVEATEGPRSSESHTCKSSETILVPPDRNLILHIWADGFREWDESVRAGKAIFVQSGTRLTLAVELEPAQ